MLNKLLKIIRRILGRCEYCGGELYIWDSHVIYCLKCGEDI